MELIAYKLIKEHGKLDKGRIFIPHGNDTILLANCTKPTQFYSGHIFNSLKNLEMLEEINLVNEKWIHPHLYKPIKKIIYLEK